MKTQYAFLAAGITIVLSCAAVASTTPPVSPQPRIIWTVVNVNKLGKVTSILPSERLPPWEHKLLMNQLHAWFNQPATNKHGKPISSRFVMKLDMRVKPTTAGAYAANFTVAKTMPINFGGPVYWNMSEPGDYLTLVSASSHIVYGNASEISVDDAPVGSRNGVSPPPPPPASGGSHH